MRKFPFSAFYAMISCMFMISSAYAWPIPDTGQTKCYNETAEITCPQPGQPFYGQDGNYLINPPSYTKLDENGNVLPDEATEWIMVRDNVTGLIWEVKQNKDGVQEYANPNDADNTYTWYDSNMKTNGGYAGIQGTEPDNEEDFIQIINTSRYGGYNDWRIPLREEFRTIMEYNNNSNLINQIFFPNTIFSSGYWTSSAKIGDGEDDKYNSWTISFSDGDSYFFNKSEKRHERAVRGIVENNMIDNQDETITDISTGLMWQQSSCITPTDWKTAIEYCSDIVHSGYEDWRLPTIKELDSIIDITKHDPAINSDIFIITHYGYWSSTTYTKDKTKALYIDLTMGDEYYKNKTEKDGYLLCVRGGQLHISENLYINSPIQASKWNKDETMSISWKTKIISGNVKIEISRSGGKEGTFETIAETTPNDGIHDWIVSGNRSYSCILRIKPIDFPSKSAVTGMFAIYGTSEIPVNDNFINSIELNGVSGTTIGANIYASLEPCESYHLKTGGKSVWWRWSTEKNSTLYLDTHGSSFDTILVVYQGQSLEHLMINEYNDDYTTNGHDSELCATVKSGTVYYIAVAGYENDSGNIVLNWRAEALPPPSNNDFAHPSIIKGIKGNTEGSNVNATKEIGEPDHADNPGGKSVWWIWTAEKAGSVNFNTSSSDVETVLAVYTGTTLENLSAVKSGSNTVIFEASAGKDYYIAVDSLNDTEGKIVLEWLETVYPSPKNDDSANATLLAGEQDSIGGTNINATLEVAEPFHPDKSIINTVWWKWTAGKSGAWHIDTQGSNFDTILEVYRLDPDNSLHPLASDDDGGADYTSNLAIEAVIGETYYISVSGYRGESGAIILNWNQSGLIMTAIAPTGCVQGETITLSISGSGFDSSTKLWAYMDPNAKIEITPVNIASSTEISGQFSSPVPGKYGIEVANSTETALLENAFTVIAKDDADVLNAKAIIVASDGPGSDILSEITWCANKAYDTLISVGYGAEDIFYLTPNDSLRQADGAPSLVALKNIFKYLTTSPPYDLVVYFIGHGEPGKFWLNKNESLETDQLALWLNNVQQVMAGGHLVFIYDACYAGSFITDGSAISPLIGPESGRRVVITSTSPGETTDFPNNGYGTFSDCFWAFIHNGHTMRDAFYAAEKKMKEWDQHPLLDTDGNGIWDAAADADKASFYLGIRNYDPDQPAPRPRFIEVMPLHRLTTDNYSANLWAEVTTSAGQIEKVWAAVIPPDYSYDSSDSTADFDVKEVILQNTGNGRYAADYPSFSKGGTYSIIFRARNTEGFEAGIRYSAVVQPAGPNYLSPDVFEDDDSPGAARPILPGDLSQYHSFHDDGDADWTRFFGYAGTLYKFTVAYPSYACNPVIQVFDAAGNPVLASGALVRADQGGLGEPETMTWRCPSDAMYYVKAWNASADVFGQTVNYFLAVTRAEGPTDFDIRLQLRDWFTGQAVENAEISLSDIILLPTDEDYPYIGDGYYQPRVAASMGSDFRLRIERQDLVPFSSEYTLTSARNNMSINISLLPARLDTVIRLLQLTSGVSVTPVEFNESFQLGGDIDADGHMGIAEAIYILRKLALQ